jgi:hypothetical protein
MAGVSGRSPSSRLLSIVHAGEKGDVHPYFYPKNRKNMTFFLFSHINPNPEVFDVPIFPIKRGTPAEVHLKKLQTKRNNV